MLRLWTGILAAAVMTVVAASPARAQSQYQSGLGLCIQPSGAESALDGDVIVQVDRSTCIDNPNSSMFWYPDPIRFADNHVWFRIRNLGALSGGIERCIDLTDGNKADWTPLQLWSCNGSDTMLWAWDTDDNGQPRIINKRSGKCMDVRGGSDAPGTVIQNYHCASFTFGRPNLAQQWFRGPR